MKKAEIESIRNEIAFREAEIEWAYEMLESATDAEERHLLLESIYHEHMAIATLPKIPSESEWDEHTIARLEEEESDRSFGRFDGPEVFA